MKIKYFVATCTVSMGLGLSSALAADLIEQPPQAVPTFSWDGGYIGTQAGYGFGKADHRLEGLDQTTSNDIHGGLLGIYGGYNYQVSGNVVLGIGADFGLSGQDGGPDTFILCSCRRQRRNSVSADVEWNAAVRGRFGYAVDRFLPYISGGLALARVHGVYDYIYADGAIDDVAAGWTLGAGVDYAFTDNVVFRAEFRYSDFGDVIERPFLPTFGSTQTLHLTSNDLLFGIGYKF
jgi:outer membrane immunogenic protein